MTGVLVGYLTGLFVVAVVLGLFGNWVAIKCGRPPIEGFVLGFLFGPLGVIIEALLPRNVNDDWKAKGWSSPAPKN